MLGAPASRGVLTPALRLAAWGHDLISDPQAGNNEARSADVFGKWLRAEDADPGLLRGVRALILVTQHTYPPSTRVEALLADADLGILGSDPQVFAAYDAAIRREYAFVPEAAYRAGRAQVLRTFLSRERLYWTPEFAGLEAQARANLSAAAQRLE
nr:phosphohydrolase [Deinococcus budaensis]